MKSEGLRRRAFLTRFGATAAGAAATITLAETANAHAGQITVNGELNKLEHNVTFGHGIHSGIHRRRDSDTSLLFGEAVALSYLQHRAHTYNEPFTVAPTKFDGTVATITQLITRVWARPSDVS